jgi:cyclic pyranopterin phosphate synthase
LADLRQPNGQPLDLTLTTNASLLARQAEALRNAGLQRLTISLDALDDATFRRMNDMDFAVADVLHGIDAAQRAGFTSIKVNMVVQRGVNDDQIVPMATYFRGRGITLRFIEYMDVGHTNGWQMQQVLPSAEVKQRVHDQFPLLPLAASAPGETAQRWGYANAQGQHDPALGESGLISSVTQAFCGDCNRARLSTEGRLFLCLFAGQGHDLRHWLRQGEDAATLSARIAGIWQGRTNQYSALRGQAQASAPDQPKVEMSYIGG